MSKRPRSELDQLLTYCWAEYGIEKLAEITWAHAVNSKSRLTAALDEAGGEAAMMLECDVLANERGEIVLAHNPGDPTDLSLNTLLETMQGAAPGLKLDFKHPATLSQALAALASAKLRQLVILNADILVGPGGRPTPFDAPEFISTCQSLYPRGILSLGWTTTSDTTEGYSAEHIDAMLRVCEGLPPLTFPLRASFLPRTWPEADRLHNHTGAVFTLWDGAPLTPQLLTFIKRALPDGNYLFDCEIADHE